MNWKILIKRLARRIKIKKIRLNKFRSKLVISKIELKN